MNEGCTLIGFSLEHYSLIGKRKLTRIKNWLARCREEDRIGPGPIVEDLDAAGTGLTCPTVKPIYFRLILKDDLSRAVRDLANCRSQFTIEELE